MMYIKSLSALFYHLFMRISVPLSRLCIILATKKGNDFEKLFDFVVCTTLTCLFELANLG